jgi:hypothetical protein
MPKINIERLKADVAQARRDRPADVGPGGRRLTGAMAIVREKLAALETLKAGGATWVQIAAGLAAQGVTQGENGEPITGRRLTALIVSVKRQLARQAAKQAVRERRADPPILAPPETIRPRARLAPELMASKGRTATSAASLTEEEIREANFNRHADLFRKG